MSKCNIELKKITTKNFDKFYSFLEEDFPFEERKSYGKQLLTLNNSRFNPNFIYLNNKKIEYICYWDFDDMIYFEHFAIFKDLRNQGYGTEFLNNFVQLFDKNIIIEIERPKETNAKRRLNFYKRLGFVVNDYDYHQPSYHDGDDSVPMCILSYKEKISGEKYNKFLKHINQYVYI